MSKRQKEVEEVVEEAGRQGWRCTLEKSGHWKCLAPDGVGIVWIAGTPSDTRWKANTIAKMRRHGFRWPVAKQPKREPPEPSTEE